MHAVFVLDDYFAKSKLSWTAGERSEERAENVTGGRMDLITVVPCSSTHTTTNNSRKSAWSTSHFVNSKFIHTLRDMWGSLTGGRGTCLTSGSWAHTMGCVCTSVYPRAWLAGSPQFAVTCGNNNCISSCRNLCNCVSRAPLLPSVHWAGNVLAAMVCAWVCFSTRSHIQQGNSLSHVHTCAPQPTHTECMIDVCVCVWGGGLLGQADKVKECLI